MIRLKLLTELLPHQVPAVEKLGKIKVGALYMEMGLGKTRTAIELIKNRFDRGKIDHILWFCPCSVKTNLIRDIKKHSKGLLEITTIIGIESISMSDREYLRALETVSKHRCYLIIDESNLVKNFFAKRTARMIELSTKCEYKLILNGTPVTRDETDLYSQWYILDRRIFGYRTYWSFAANHLEYDDYGRVRRVLNVDYLTNKIAPYSYQLKKSDAGISLPSKKYDNFYFEMTVEQEYHYEMVRDEMLSSVDEFDSTTIYRLLTALQLVTSGRQVWGLSTSLRHEPFFKNYLGNPRIRALRNIIKRLDDKCIIWCKYMFEIKEVSKLLSHMGLTFSLFHGGITPRQRELELSSFMKDTQFLVANKACGGYGLNLQFCSNMIFYSNDYNWGDRVQAEDRVHRIGQEKTVFITDIVADSKIDERIKENLDRKEGLDAYVTRLLNDKNSLMKL